jgi:hypothetical protein
MPYPVYKEKSDKAAERLARSGTCYLKIEKLDSLVEQIEHTLKIDLKKPYDIESTKKILKGVSLSEIVNKMRAEKYEDA